MRQTTIKRSVEGIGIGLHKGEPVKIILEPLEENSGIVFYRMDENVFIEAKPENVSNTQMATVIAKDNCSISTIEHLLSAIYAYGIDNLLIKVDAPEVPVMDGSSASFCMLLDEAGILQQNRNKKIIVIKKEVLVEDGNKFVKLRPSRYSAYDFSIKFDHPAIGDQNYNFHFSKRNYIKDVSRARTFGFLKDIQYLRSQNLALGGSLDNAIVLDEKKILNSDGLRYHNEFVRHKILDAIGDLMLIGMPFVGKYSSHAGSHHLNHLLTKKLLKDRSNYEIKTFEQEELFALSKAFA